jgi:hypothetical protein
MPCRTIASIGGMVVLCVWLLVLAPWMMSGVSAAPMILKHRVVKTGSDPVHGRSHTTSKRQTSLTSVLPNTMYAIQFRVPLDESMITRLTTILSYEPREYVPPDSLVIYFSSQPIVDSFIAEMSESVRHVERMLNSDRQDDHSIVLDKLRHDHELEQQQVQSATQSHQESVLALRLTAKQNKGTEFRNHAAKVGRPPVSSVRLRYHSFHRSGDTSSGATYKARVQAAVEEVLEKDNLASLKYEFDAKSGRGVIENVPVGSVEALSESLVALFDEMFWIEITPPHRVQMRWAAPAVHRSTDAFAIGLPSPQRDSMWTPFLGLTGSGVPIGISDTGVAAVCAFTQGRGSGAGPIPYVQGFVRPVANAKYNQKFIVYSNGVGGDFADTDGHGTSVASIAAGQAAPGTDVAFFDGVAPQSPLVFTDLQAQLDPSLNLPTDMSTIYAFQQMFGANISVQSYGYASNGQGNTDTYDFDLYAYNNPTFIGFTAAGNSGDAADSIVSPSDAKSAISVGAVENTYESIQLAQTPAYGSSAYGARQRAVYSGVGSNTRPIKKPNVMSVGGPNVWSASYQSPASGACTSAEDCTLGFTGTSMATPNAAGLAAIMTQALLLDRTASASGQALVDGGGVGLPISGSLIAALMYAAGANTDGSSPNTVYVSDSDRENHEGYGFASADRALGDKVALRIISNSNSDFALKKTGDSMRTCISIIGLPVNTTLTNYELVIQLVYNDYPSSPNVPLGLVNDLDLYVSSLGASLGAVQVNYNTPGTTETRSAAERVIVSPARAVDVQVMATKIGFGSGQRFSLIAVLRMISPFSTIQRMILATPMMSGALGVCSTCSAAAPLVPSSTCTRCGDGRVDVSSGEQCEIAVNGPDCCDPLTCKWLVGGSLCSIDTGMCVLQGSCGVDPTNSTNQICLANMKLSYSRAVSAQSTACVAATPSPPTPTTLSLVTKNNNAIVTTPSPTTPTICARNSSDWLSELRLHGLPLSISTLQTPDVQICCQDFRQYAFTNTPDEPSRYALTVEYIAARLNVAQSGFTVSAQVLILIKNAKALLEAHCGSMGFTDPVVRTLAIGFTTNLIMSINQRLQTSSCVAAPNTWTYVPISTSESWCSATQSTTLGLVNLLCSGAPNNYTFASGSCVCDASRQPNEPDCAHLSCGGNGVSLYNYTSGQQQCLCMPGWTGAMCTTCGSTITSGLRFLCVGTPTSSAKGTPKWILRVVDSSTLASRLSGSFYPSGVTKNSDVLPGTSDLDCACRLSSGVPKLTAYDSHLQMTAVNLVALQAQFEWASQMDSIMSSSAASSNNVIQTPIKNSAQSLKLGVRINSGSELINGACDALYLVMIAWVIFG